jgi:hypothetical protein
MIVADVSTERPIGFEFVYTRPTPASVWVIAHNMDCHPSVTVIDSGNNQVEGAITYDSMDQVTISFTGGFSGKAIFR